MIREAKGSHLRDSEIHGEWVPGCEGRYSVTRDGVAYSFVYNKIRKLKQFVSDRGYKRCNFRLEKQDTRRIHQIVALTYLGPRPEGAEIHHKDGDKFNNHVDNLEYCTKSHNLKEAFRLGRLAKAGEQHYGAKLTEKQAMEIYIMTTVDEVPVKQVAKIFNLSEGAVEGIKHKRNWKCMHK